jgi:glyoxylase-like metal-dependent hydrolase (beta-lactamase superfamily II)
VLSETRVSERVFVWTLGGETIETSWGANCVGVIGGRGVLLVDPLIAPAHARLVEKAVARRTRLPVRHVLLTHHHTDHALGASHFERQGAEVLAHRACAERMEAEHPELIASRRAAPETAALFADAEPYRPARIFEDRVILDLGGLEVRVFHGGPGHTAGDSIAYVPGESVAICGDLVSSGYHVNMEDAVRSGVEASLDALARLGARTFVPGHGPSGDAALLGEQRSYHRAVAETVREGSRAGLSDREIEARLARRFPLHRLRLVLPAAIAAWRS